MARSHDRDTTKGGHADGIPVATGLVPFVRVANELTDCPIDVRSSQVLGNAGEREATCVQPSQPKQGVFGFLVTSLLPGGLRGQLQSVIAAQARIAAAATRAAELGNVQLRTVVDCANASMDAYLQNLNEGMKPFNRLVALLNLFPQLAGLSPIPDFKNLGDDAEAALAPLDAVIDSLKTIRMGLPG